MRTSRPFAILTLCTGNICRSPAMQLLLAHELTERALPGTEGAPARFIVSSAGTRAVTGQPMSAPMDRLLRQRGLAVGAFAACQADAGMLRGADLILTAAREHRAWAIALVPDAVRRTFTLTEFAAALSGAEQAGLSAVSLSAADLVTWAAAHRPAGVGQGRDEGDILDPYGREDAAHAASLAQIATPTERVATALRATLA